jgi:hypothetical protein
LVAKRIKRIFYSKSNSATWRIVFVE